METYIPTLICAVLTLVFLVYRTLEMLDHKAPTKWTLFWQLVCVVLIAFIIGTNLIKII